LLLPPNLFEDYYYPPHLLGVITVLIFGDYYVAFWGLLLSSISGIIQATLYKERRVI
jgi:hypothetical protein